MNYRRLYSSTKYILKSNSRVKIKPPWWVKISTSQPECLYYFGSFSSKLEAIETLPGYLEDLEGERAEGIVVEIEQGYPERLTISVE